MRDEGEGARHEENTRRKSGKRRREELSEQSDNQFMLSDHATSHHFSVRFNSALHPHRHTHTHT